MAEEEFGDDARMKRKTPPSQAGFAVCVWPGLVSRPHTKG